MRIIGCDRSVVLGFLILAVLGCNSPKENSILFKQKLDKWTAEADELASQLTDAENVGRISERLDAHSKKLDVILRSGKEFLRQSANKIYEDNQDFAVIIKEIKPMGPFDPKKHYERLSGNVEAQEMFRDFLQKMIKIKAKYFKSE